MYDEAPYTFEVTEPEPRLAFPALLISHHEHITCTDVIFPTNITERVAKLAQFAQKHSFSRIYVVELTPVALRIPFSRPTLAWKALCFLPTPSVWTYAAQLVRPRCLFFCLFDTQK